MAEGMTAPPDPTTPPGAATSSHAPRRLPPVTAIDDPSSMERARELLTRAGKFKRQADEAERELKDIRSELAVLAIGFNLPGLKDGLNGFYYGGKTSRSTLDKGLLMESGVSPEVIAQCYTKSKEWDDIKIVIFDR